MRSHMVLEVDFLCKLLAAQLTLVQLPSVYAFMDLQEELVTKWLLAILAVEELSCVEAFMVSQVDFL